MSLNSNGVSSLNKNTQTGQNDVPRENRAEVTSDQTATTQPTNTQDQTVITQPQKKQQTSSDQNSVTKLQQKNSLDNLGQNQIASKQAKQNLAQKINSRLNKKVLATNLIETTSSPITNGGFDEAIWGKLDVNNWQGSVQDGLYQLTGYTGDLSHVIVPNEADFEKAGKSTNGLQVGIIKYTIRSLRSRGQTIAFSKTNNQKVKAIGTDWSYAFVAAGLSKFDGSNLDVSGVTNMSFMFGKNSISDLTSLADWNTSNVTEMNSMFAENSISSLTGLDNWDVSNVTEMVGMFGKNSISDLTPLANWDTSKVTEMGYMFAYNPDLNDLRPIANWNISNVNINNADDDGFSDLFADDTKLDLTNIKDDASLMQGFLKEPDALGGATFITNNADLVKATTGKDLPNLTNTAKRTIVFYFPNDVPKTIVQIINYKTIAPVQISFDPDSDSDSGEIVQTYPVKESDWYLDTSNSNVTVNGQPSTEYKAYTLDPNGKDIDFAAIPLPKIPGYKAEISRIPSGNSAQPAMFLVSFVALPSVHPGTQNAPDNTKQDQGAVINTKHLNTANMQVVSNQPVLLENADNSVQMLNTANNLQTLNTDTNTSTWQIENSVEDKLIAPYVVFNSNYKLHLPRFNNYNLQIIKRTSNKDNLSFVYLNQNKTFKYVFNIKIEDGKYLLSISQFENKRLIPAQKISFTDYHQLIKLIVKLINK